MKVKPLQGWMKRWGGVVPERIEREREAKGIGRNDS